MTIQKYRIAFMGTPEVSAQYIETLFKNHYNIVAVYSQPARPKGRGMKAQPSPVQVFAEKKNLPFFSPISLSDKKEFEHFKSLNIDLAIVIGYGNLIPENFLKQSTFGFINIHFSLLPKWRGASPIEHSLLNGDSKTGVTIFKLIKNLDAGPILSSEEFIIDDLLTKQELELKLNLIGKNLLIKTLVNYFDNKIQLQEQDSQNQSYASKITTNTRQIDFSKTAKEVYNQIRAFSPSPGAWFILNNERIKIISCSIKNTKGESSTVLSENFIIGCSDQSIEPLVIQREGKQSMKVEEFLRGFVVKIGDKIRYNV